MRFLKFIAAQTSTLLLLIMAAILGAVLSRMVDPPDHTPLDESGTIAPTVFIQPTNTLRPGDSFNRVALLSTSTPLPEPTHTLKPPPTFEPPTLVPEPSVTPTLTATATLPGLIDVPGLHGMETPTPSSTPGCTPRAAWKLTYNVQANDTLDNIAARYGSDRWEMTEANCLVNPDEIYIGQTLRVPGDAHPETVVECLPWDVLTPMHYAYGIDGNGELRFNWVGPRADRNLIRIFNSNDEMIWEEVVDRRQNHLVFLPDILPDEEGTFTWQVFPLNLSFQQINCLESPRWLFHKTAVDDTQFP